MGVAFLRHGVNQSKFHYGLEFGALGLLCPTATDWHLFPVWVRLIAPQMLRDKSYAVLKRICSKIPPGLIIFDRGFAWRKVFTMALRLGHHILCRAKSNAVFYRLPKPPKHRQCRATHLNSRVKFLRFRFAIGDSFGLFL